LIWRVVISPDLHASYDAVAKWPLPRVIAAIELTDILAEMRARPPA
jgi:hypothetical protein